jgi:SAM-dependent methyltransferase
MAVWEDHLLPRLINVLCGSKAIGWHRPQAVVGLSGSVVEIGFGSGLNVPLYPAEVTTLYAVEPSSVGRKLGAKRLELSSVPVEFVGLDGQALPLGSESVDAALSTFTLCTIPDVAQALGELLRVLRPGGQFHFLEHGIAPDPVVAGRQHRFNGFQGRVAGGCHLDRPIDRLVTDAGFEISTLKNDWIRGPKVLRPWNYLYVGVATKPA